MRRFLPFFAVLLAMSSPALAQNRITVVPNCSGTIATGGASQQILPVNPDRNFLFVQNPITATETLFVNYDAAASTTSGSVNLAPGGSISFLAAATPTTIITVTAATTGHTFVCKSGGGF